MSKHITAIYRTHAVATDVKRSIEALDVHGHNITVTPDDPNPVAAGNHREDHHVSAIDRLNLPDDDQRIYKRAVREGNYVVSVKVDDDERTSMIEDAMRHPEHGVDIDAYEASYRSHPDYATDVERDRSLAARENVYTRDTTRTASHSRTYG